METSHPTEQGHVIYEERHATFVRPKCTCGRFCAALRARVQREEDAKMRSIKRAGIIKFAESRSIGGCHLNEIYDL